MPASQQGGRFYLKKGAISNGEEKLNIMTTEEKSRYYEELTQNLRHEGFTVGPRTEEDLLLVELDGRRLCLVLGSGGIRYREEDAAGGVRSKALHTVTDIAQVTAEYMRQIELAPKLTADGLAGDYRQLASFNDVVLAGHPTKCGVQFVTWEKLKNQTILYAGNYFGPGTGIASYTAAKKNFVARSGLIQSGALFSPEQLTEIYRSCGDVLEAGFQLTADQEKYLQGICAQIRDTLPDLDVRLAGQTRHDLPVSGQENLMGYPQF